MKRSDVGPGLDQDSAAVAGLVSVDAEERGHVCDAGCLLHVVGDDYDRVIVFEDADQILDCEGRDRVERRGRLVHQDHVRLDRERPRDAQALLLATRERKRALLQAILDLIPKRGVSKRLLDAVAQVVLHAVQTQSEGDVVVDRLGKRVWPLEHHPDAAAYLNGVHSGSRTSPGRGR